MVDDNPAERQIVRQLVPQVDVVALPREPAGYRRTLSEYLGFESVAITSEDRARSDESRPGQKDTRAPTAALKGTPWNVDCSWYRKS